MRSIFTLVIGGLLLVGCQTQTVKQSENATTLAPQQLPTRTVTPSNLPPVQGKGVAFDVDDCAARMQTLEGQLMFFYFKYHKLPVVLDQLRSVADPGEEVPTACPISHQPYSYNPDGLVFGADMRRLVAYDSSPAHSGTRWGILFSQAKGREPVNMQVIQIPEASMVGYHPAPPTSASSPSTMPDASDEIPPDIRARMEEQLRMKRIEQMRLQRQLNNPDAGQQQPIIQQPPAQQPPVQQPDPRQP